MSHPLRPAIRSAALALSLCILALAGGCGGASPPPRTPDDEPPPEPPRYGLALRFEDAGADEREVPRTRVALVRISDDGERAVVELSTEVGACYATEVPGALLGGRCWWAGQGAVYDVRREGDEVVARRAAEQEGSDATLPPVEVGRLELPADAQLQLVAPAAPSP